MGQAILRVELGQIQFGQTGEDRMDIGYRYRANQV